MNTKKTLLIQVLIATLPFVYLYILWQHLPEKVPMHFNAQNIADSYGNKSELLVMSLFLFGVTIGVAALILNINKIDPQQAEKTDLSLMRKISWVLVIFLTLMQFLILHQIANYQPQQPDTNGVKWVFLLITLLFVVLGNLMQNIKPNFFVGIRTPWTLSSEDNWKKTHRLMSKIWFFGGLVMLLLILVLPAHYSFTVFIIGIIVLTIIPLGFSFLYFQKEKRENETKD